MRVDLGHKATDALIVLCLNDLPDITDLNAFNALMKISIKYRVTGAARRLKRDYLTLAMSQPTCYFQSFCRALLYGWEEEARIIALRVLQRRQQDLYFTDFEGYPGMDSIPARPIANLLRCGRLLCRRSRSVLPPFRGTSMRSKFPLPRTSINPHNVVCSIGPECPVLVCRVGLFVIRDLSLWNPCLLVSEMVE